MHEKTGWRKARGVVIRIVSVGRSALSSSFSSSHGGYPGAFQNRQSDQADRWKPFAVNRQLAVPF